MLSVIIPHYHEHPQLIFTLQALINDLDLVDDLEYEILVVNNAPTPQHEHAELDSVRYIQKKQEAGELSQVVLLDYLDTISHWQAKNKAVEHARGDILLFLDAHVLLTPSAVEDMLDNFGGLPAHSSLHLPITYMLEGKSNALIYELVSDLGQGKVDYRFTKYTSPFHITEVSCMSTCGMMIARDTLVNFLGGWPSSLGSYSGGEQFINFVGAVLGLKKFVINAGVVCHYAAPRAYDIVYDDVYRNRAIATFLFGGMEMTHAYLDGLCFLQRGKISQRAINKIRVEIPSISDLQARRRYIEDNQKTSIEAFIEKWSN